LGRESGKGICLEVKGGGGEVFAVNLLGRNHHRHRERRRGRGGGVQGGGLLPLTKKKEKRGSLQHKKGVPFRKREEERGVTEPGRGGGGFSAFAEKGKGIFIAGEGAGKGRTEPKGGETCKGLFERGKSSFVYDRKRETQRAHFSGRTEKGHLV